MRTLPRIGIVGVACLSSFAASAQGQTATYRCAGGLVVKARFPNAMTTIVSIGGRAYRLRNTMAASGSRYAGQGVTFWEHHGEATIKRAGKSTSCR
jgi:membrane-bound inhibitor of C-type lysozyme